MIANTLSGARTTFDSLPDRTRVAILLAVYAGVAIALVHGLGLEAGSMGGWTGLGGVSSLA